MATTVKLFPTKDIKVNHFKSTKGKGYTLIDEVTADDDSTYLSQTLEKSKKSVFSTFSVTPFSEKKIVINDMTILIRAKTSGSSFAKGEIGVGISFDNFSKDEALVPIDNTWQDYTLSISSLVNINDYIKTNGTFPKVTLKISSSGQNNDPKNNPAEIRITQVYITIQYTIQTPSEGTLLLKEAGQWREYTEVFEKKAGEWIKVDISSFFGKMQNQQLTIYKKGGD